MYYNIRKKIIFSALFLGLFFPVFAQQNSDIPPFSGSSYFRKFSIGINGGVLNPSLLIGGSNDFANPEYTIGYGANIRYQLNHYLGFQIDYQGGTLKGDQNGSGGAGRPVTSFKTNLDLTGSLSAIISFGSINWLRQNNILVPYVSVGGGYISYKPKIVEAGTTTPVAFDGGNMIKNLYVPVGAGVKINLSSLINLDLGYRMNFVDADNLDGTELEPLHHDKFSYGFLGIEFAFGNQSKPRMLFDNPAARVNSYLINQVDTVSAKQTMMMTDSDGDGVPDYLDKEPNTPKGCPVDVHGVSLDTDGDGVPDCRDKELITPTECQPVDADGVGKCPPPECCKMLDSTLKAMTTCNITDLPSITFNGNTAVLSSNAKTMLATVGSKLKSSAECSITITGYPAASKVSQALTNKRLDNIKSYLMTSEGIGSDRMDVNYQIGGGDPNTVDIKPRQ